MAPHRGMQKAHRMMGPRRVFIPLGFHRPGLTLENLYDCRPFKDLKVGEIILVVSEPRPNPLFHVLHVLVLREDGTFGTMADDVRSEPL